MHAITSELVHSVASVYALVQFEVHPYVHYFYVHIYYKYFSSRGMVTKISDMLNKKMPGAVKKGTAKQSRIKSIAWHLR